MSDPRHMPGPWFVDGFDKTGQAIVRGEHIEIATCWHHCVGSLEKEMNANARLIAASPMLLEALIAVRDRFQHYHDSPDDNAVMDRVNAAIAAATGEA